MTPTEHTLLEALRNLLEHRVPSAEIRARGLIEQYEGQNEDEFRRLAPLVGADPDWFDVTFMNMFTVMGISPSRSKNAMDIRDNASGKMYRCSADYVRRGMPRAEPATPEPRRRTRKRKRERELDLTG